MLNNQIHAEKIRNFMKDHNKWMEESINLIASENITSSRVKEALTSDLSHRYAEGLPGKRFYEGCYYIDKIEELAIDLCKKLFKAEHVNVQPTSGVVANLATFFALTNVGDSVMALEIPYGGHLSHAKVSAVGVRGLRIQSHPFDADNMNIDAEKMKKKIIELKPQLIILGGSLFLFPHPIEEAREAADEVGASIMYDGAHVLGLIAGKCFQDPLKEGVDVLVGSTHKTFPGPQGGIILCGEELADKMDEAVFPGLVSNHHLHHVAGLGITAAEMLEFGEAYAKDTIKNAKKLAENLYESGFNVLCEDLGFTESHQLVMDVSDIGRAVEMAKKLEENNIILNKNLLPWDDVNRSNDPSGIRIGTQEVTRRGMRESEMAEIAEYIKRVLIDKKDVKEEVSEFMADYTRVHYAFEESEAYKYLDII